MKSSISTAVRELIVSRLNDSTPQEVLRIASAIAANEQIEAVSLVAARAAPGGASEARPRFTRLADDGSVVLSGGSWIHDRTTNLIWASSVLSGEFTHADALKACEKVKFKGIACRAPTIQERFSLTDFSKSSPALDTDYFAKESGYEWTSTLDASSPSDCAWGVGLGYGGVLRDDLDGRYHVRPVLAGQSLTFSF